MTVSFTLLCVSQSTVGSTGDAYNSHTETPEEAVRNVLLAGTDIDCGTFVTRFAASALNKSIITVKDIDDRLVLILSHYTTNNCLSSIAFLSRCASF